MGLNDTPSGERVHIGFFGMRNAGKSSVVNAVTAQQLSVVSDVLGTTTDPVRKAMELLPVGPVVIIDTPGIDDKGKLGTSRVEKTREVLRSCNVAVLVVDAAVGLRQPDRDLLMIFAAQGIPCVIAANKMDLLPGMETAMETPAQAAMGTEAAGETAALTKTTAASSTTAVAGVAVETCPLSQRGDAPEPAEGRGSQGVASRVLGEVSEAMESWARTQQIPERIPLVPVCGLDGWGIFQLKETIAAVAAPSVRSERVLIADLISSGDVVVLVVPIDESAPKGRIILPQQMVLRDALDCHASCCVCQPEELAGVLAGMSAPPRLVITDSQAFGKVSSIVPREVPLTSFSILMARYKGNLDQLTEGVAALESLQDGDKVLIAEGCTHHRQCNDIGTVKLPGWIRAHTGVEPEFVFTSGREFPQDLVGMKLVVHCGGCMLNQKEMQARLAMAAQQHVPMVNYGIAIARMHGILQRSLEPVTE